MLDLPVFRDHPTSLWDYLGDMPYMPSAADRAMLQKRAAARVPIWDYFFQPRRDDVGKPLRAELDERRSEAATGEREAQETLRSSLDRLAELEQKREAELSAFSDRLRDIESNTAANERAQATRKIRTGTALAGGSALAGFSLYMFGINASTQSGPEGCFAVLGATCFSVAWVFLGIPIIIAGLWLIYSGNRRLAPERIQAIVDLQQKALRDEWARTAQQIAMEMEKERSCAEAAREVLGRLIPHLLSRIGFLEKALEHLLSQLPPVPSEEQVEDWLKTDLRDLQAKGEEELGVEGQAVNLLGTENPFLIRGPAEIQRQDVIPPTYRSGNPYSNPDRMKYLSARQFGRLPNGKAFQHYGVFYLEILFITGAVLARYSVFYDFIRGELIGERAPQQHFVDVTLLEMRREYREIMIEGEAVPLERAPSMMLTLNSGDQVVITLPSPEYFQKVGAAAMVAAKGDYNAITAADSAMRAITQCVNEAKKNLEIGQLARMKEADRDL